MTVILTWIESSSSLEIAEEFVKLKEQISDLKKQVIAADLDSKVKKEEKDVWCSLAKKWLIESNQKIKELEDRIDDLISDQVRDY
jgi:hypothetical protein